MNPWRWVDPRIKEVRPADLPAYFEAQGWRLVPNPNPHMLRFEKKKGRYTLYQLIPAHGDDGDGSFRQRTTELLTTLSEIEGRHPVAILEDILRLQGQELTNGARAAAKSATRRRKAASE